MAINKNHEFEELDGIKCAIVEKGVTIERAQFLKSLLEVNHYTVVILPSPPPKAKPTPEGGDTANQEPVTIEPETFTIGVTDVMFNPINAIFGRLLKTKTGETVTLAYWNQQEPTSNAEIPYYEFK